MSDLIWVKFKDDFYDEDYKLIIEKRFYDEEEHIILDPQPVFTIKDLAQMGDNDLESANYHSLCGVHEWLGNILIDKCGEEKALEIMLEIINQGGFMKYC
jgi:hypothetical protein